jgi:Flp pilus assembly protein TadB
VRPNALNRRKGVLAKRLLQAGLTLSPAAYSLSVLALAAAIFMLLKLLGLVVACFGAVLTCYYFLFEYLDERALKRKRKVVRQLAPFIDGMVSGLATGFNLDAAFTQAAAGVPKGILRDELERVVHSMNAGFTMREAVTSLRERIPGQEIVSLTVSISLFASMGGVVLDPFRRLGAKIREQQQVMEKAGRDLVMVKQSFYLLFFLSMAVPPVLVLLAPEYLSGALEHTLARALLQAGAITVLLALCIFKRITNVRI